jgi:hypothetical protein
MTKGDNRNGQAQDRPICGRDGGRGGAATEASLLRPGPGAALVLTRSIAFGTARVGESDLAVTELGRTGGSRSDPSLLAQRAGRSGS